MADEWALQVRERNKRWATLEPGLHEPDELIVVNSFGPPRPALPQAPSPPLLGEALTLRRDVDILYDTTTSVRRRWLYDSFRRGGTLEGRSCRSRRVHSGFRRATRLETMTRRERARAVLSALGNSEQDWDARVLRTRRVKTTLSRIHEGDAADLIYHGYVLAMANLHVLLEHPLVPLPPEQRFAELVASGQGVRA